MVTIELNFKKLQQYILTIMFYQYEVALDLDRKLRMGVTPNQQYFSGPTHCATE